MTQVSKYPVSENVYERIFDIYIKVVVGLKTRRQAELFLTDFLTPTEQIMFAKRFAIAFLLAEGYRYEEISRILRVSTTTIGNVSLQLKYRKHYKRVVHKVSSDEKTKKSLLDAVEVVLKVLSAPSSKTKSWRYLKEEVQKRNTKPF